MLNKLCAALREDGMIAPGDSLVCALSGGADSVALLFGLYLLREKLDFTLSAAHFNHHLRGAESDGDEEFVRRLCQRYDIPLYVGGGQVIPGEKGLEAAAREERYRFLGTLPGKIVTAHTADDNAETVLMHLLRGTGLKGLGGIAPVSGRVIRPMLAITRREVEEFLEEYALPHREDSSNAGNQFLRNRIRHGVMPLLTAENPGFSESVSAMARRLRQDETYIQQQLGPMPGVSRLRQLPPALRSRYLERFLKECGVPEPEQTHIALAKALAFSEKPSARADFPGGVVIERNYDSLRPLRQDPLPAAQEIPLRGVTELPQWGIHVICGEDGFGFCPVGKLVVRARQPGDTMRLPGGVKTLKKLMIDRKISASDRPRVPVLADERGVLAVAGIGPNLDRLEENPAVLIRIEKIER